MTDTDPSPPEPVDPSAGSRSGRRWLIVAVLAVVAAVVFAGLWRLEASDADDLATDRDDRRAVEQTAAAFGEAYLSIEIDDVEAWSDAIDALSTGDFAEDFRTNRAPAIKEYLEDLGTRTEATTKEVFVSAVGSRSARALVVVDVAATSSSLGDQTLKNFTFVVDLVHADGRWRIDSLSPVPQLDFEGEPTATTTAPAAPEAQP